MKRLAIAMLVLAMVVQAEKKYTEPVNMMGMRVKNVGTAQNDGDAVNRLELYQILAGDGGDYNTWKDPGLVAVLGQRLAGGMNAITNQNTAWWGVFGNSGCSTISVVELLWQPIGKNTSEGITNNLVYIMAATNKVFGVATNQFVGKAVVNTAGGVLAYSYTSSVPMNATVFGQFLIADIDNTYTQAIVRIRYKFVK